MKLGGNLLGQTCFFSLKLLTKALDQSDETVLQAYDCWKMKESQNETDCETSFVGLSLGFHQAHMLSWDSIEKVV